MSEMLYKELIKDMTWSHTRVTCFEDCRYKWYIKYLLGMEEEPEFYASYGSFMHKLLESYYKGESTRDELVTRFLLEFSEQVKGRRPSAQIVQNYIKRGFDYLNTFQDIPYMPVEIEGKYIFEIFGHKFVGIIDYLGEKDGEYYIVDHKSRELKPRSNRKKPTKKDEELDEMLTQLYVYSAGVKQRYGKFPKGLCFNCFKNNVFIEEEFKEQEYEKALIKVSQIIQKIENETEFRPTIDYFNCMYLCGLHDECLFWQNRGT